MRVKLGSRVFAPSTWATLLTALLLTIFVGMGRWQLHRAQEKRALVEAFATGTDSTLNADTGSTVLNRYQHVQLSGRFDPTTQVFIDNMFDARGRAGYYVITPFQSRAGQWWLVNRGWVPMGTDRKILPSTPAGTSERSIRGRVDRLPRPGLRMGKPARLAAPFPIRAAYPGAAELHAVIGPRRWSDRAEVILLDADEPDGFAREWMPPGIPPMRHIAYAAQWFGLAAALLVLYVVRNLES
ncbi:MAG: SURF1 family protein [Proteobacteria bacterium]|nr:SURF1 family protein [Pseudomonadota bacterium]